MPRFDGLSETTVAVLEAAEVLALTLGRLETCAERQEAMEALRRLGVPPMNGMDSETGGPGSCDDGALFNAISDFVLRYKNPIYGVDG